MLGDVLVGNAPDYNGAITNLAGIHTGEAWFLDRRFVVRCTDYTLMIVMRPLCCVCQPCCKRPCAYEARHYVFWMQYQVSCCAPTLHGMQACLFFLLWPLE